MTRVVKRVESDDVRVEQRAEDLLPPRKRPENFGRRERRVEEESALDPVEPLPQQAREDQQVIVVDPHKVVLQAP